MMVTFLKPHKAVKCPNKDGELVGIGTCRICEHLLELQIPWRGFIVKCSVEGKSDNVTVEY